MKHFLHLKLQEILRKYNGALDNETRMKLSAQRQLLDELLKTSSPEIVVDFVNTTKEAKWRLNFDNGKFKSRWDSYYVGIHVAEYKGIKYGYATQYWSGVLPTETTFVIIPITDFKVNEITK